MNFKYFVLFKKNYAEFVSRLSLSAGGGEDIVELWILDILFLCLKWSKHIDNNR